MRQRLWLGSAGVCLFIVSLVCVYAVIPRPVSKQGTVGQDFIAFYTAGEFLREGRSRSLYDLHAIGEYQHALARRFGDDLGTAVGPWWNPPFYAWLFYPYSHFSYPVALWLWLASNVVCAGVAIGIMTTWVARAAPGEGWEKAKTWLLVPVLVVLSTPFLQSLTHAQNTGMSLLLLTVVVMAWRRERAFAAGLALGLLGYKPQLAAVVAVVLTISLGWRALAGLAITGGMLLLVNVLTLPGTLGDYRHLLPDNLHHVLAKTTYLWDRHVTLKAFWRLLLQGFAAGEPTLLVKVLTWGCVGTLGAALLRAALVTRGAMVPVARGATALVTRGATAFVTPGATTPVARDGRRLDRLITATIVSTPLLMPFYFDYDQLLLAVPIVLLAVEVLEERCARPASGFGFRPWQPLFFYYPWLMINPDVAGLTRVNMTVVFLAVVAGVFVTRASGRRAVGTPGLVDDVVEMRPMAA